MLCRSARAADARELGDQNDISIEGAAWCLPSHDRARCGRGGLCAKRRFHLGPIQLPETRGVVKQYTLTPRGDVDGMILNDGTEVMLPPHLTSQIVFAVRPGDAVTIRGLRARALPLVEAASVTNSATGASVVDSGLRVHLTALPANRQSAARSLPHCTAGGARSTARYR